MREIGQRVPEEHKGKKPHLTSEQWSQIEQANMGEPGILEFMISQLDKVGTLVGSMHWTLVTFKRPLLVTCDHPVSMIDLDVFRGTVDPEPIPRTGLLSAVEIRFPVSPTRGLVLSWLDEPDLIRSRAWAGDQENFNYATRAQAEQQWFSRPRSVIRISESEYPLLTQRIRRYDRRAVEQSPRRRKVLEIITDKIEHDATPGELAIVELRPPDAG